MKKFTRILSLIACAALTITITGCKDFAKALDDFKFEEAYDKYGEPIVSKAQEIDYEGIYNDYIKPTAEQAIETAKNIDYQELYDKYLSGIVDKISSADYEAIIKSISDYANLSSDTLAPEEAKEQRTYIILNENVPYFDENELTTKEFEKYSDLDKLGRCGVAFANISQATMPAEKRGSIGQVKPTGWHTIKYDIVNGKYLYNRCHLIGYQLAGENANEKNLITGTRFMNTVGMLPFENAVAEYVKTTANHVMYRVTPVFVQDNLVASGVQIEARSIEDDGVGICFNVFVFNIQPGIEINYATGDSSLITE